MTTGPNPIKIEKLLPTEYKFIEWMLHNVCNYDCSFCYPESKGRDIKWKTLDQYKSYVDKLIKICDGKPVWFQFTGGEPTLFPDLLELLQYVKDKGAYVSLISNGSRTIRWWEELREKKCIDQLFITCHVEQIDSYQHVIDLLNLFHDEPVETICMITHTIPTFQKAIDAKKLIQQNTGTVIILKAMTIVSFDIYKQYNEDQIKELIKPRTLGDNFNTKVRPKHPEAHQLLSTMVVSYDDGTKKIANSQYLMKTKQNVFTDWKCAVGIDTMRILGDKVYRGVCNVGGMQYSLDDDISFSSDYIKCTRDKCFCSTDIVTTKIK